MALFSAAAVKSTFTSLTRLTQRRPQKIETLLAPALRRRPEAAPLALEVAVETGPPIGTTLASVLEGCDDLGHLEDLAERCARPPFVDSFYLRQVAWVTTSRVVAVRWANRTEGASSAELAVWLERHGRIASLVGERQLALIRAQQAVDRWRMLAEKKPFKHQVDLARSLNNLGLLLRDAELFEQALRIFEEEVTLYRGLARVDSAIHLPFLGRAYSNLSLALRDMGQLDGALRAAQAATEIEERLAEADHTNFKRSLATSLNNLATHLRENGRLSDSLDVARESTRLYREHASDFFDQSGPELALALGNLGMILNDHGRRDEALAFLRETVQLDRSFAEAIPRAFESQLALSLTNLGKVLSENSEPNEAWWATREAVDIYRRLVEQQSGLFRTDLARALSNFVNRSLECNQIELAYETALEAVALLRRLDQDFSGETLDERTADLAIGLINLSKVAWALGRKDEGLSVGREAVAILGRLHSSEHRRHERAMALSNLGAFLQQCDRPEEALGHLREAVVLRRLLVKEQPLVAAPELVMSLGALALTLRDLDSNREAFCILEEALRVLEPPCRALPGHFEQLLDVLSSSYQDLAEQEGFDVDEDLTALGSGGHHDEA